MVPRIRSLRWRALLVVVVAALLPLVLFQVLLWVSAPEKAAELWSTRPEVTRAVVGSIPLAVALAWWLGWRMMRPIEKLRAQALERARAAVPKQAHLELPRRDEFGELTEAINALLSALEARARANEAFVADLAHELKNPVAAIRAAAESLGAIEGERASRLSRVLEDSTRRLDTLVTQLLELARAEAGLPREARGRVDLAALLRGLCASFAADERWRSVHFALDAPSSAVEVEGVDHRLESVFRNLLDNAASFSPEGAEVQVSLRTTPSSAAVTIADHGPGIAPTDLPRVFDRFYTTRGERRGTGLGLALARAVVESHAGTITVTSPPSQGATFTITLPR